jgi:glycosyltransferase involved in cell wall biosynthesis
MKVSVVIPTYNRRELVLQCLDSVRRQTVAAYEIIVVCDGSTDGTAEAIRAKHADVKVLECANRGLAMSRNRGLAVASGDWVAYLDDDDLWHPEKLLMATNYVTATPECSALNNPHWYFSATENGPLHRNGISRNFVGKNLDELIGLAKAQPSEDETRAAAALSTNGDSFRTYLKRDRGVISSIVVRRELLIRVGGSSPSQVCNEDWTLFLNVARLAEWHTLPRRLGFTRFHENQITNSEPNDLLFSLCHLINAWFCGRPMPHRVTLQESLELLGHYGSEYRKAIANFHWSALKSRNWRLASQIRLVGKILLPSRLDRIYSMIPPPIVWRLDRYVSGKHTAAASEIVANRTLASEGSN